MPRHAFSNLTSNVMSPKKDINYCDHCHSPILHNKDNYAGTFDDYCCKRCNDAADVEWNAHNECDATESDLY